MSPIRQCNPAAFIRCIDRSTEIERPLALIAELCIMSDSGASFSSATLQEIGHAISTHLDRRLALDHLALGREVPPERRSEHFEDELNRGKKRHE